ncbi:hypothetical protein FHW83_000545 [Duganella sp. SG902]|uniref:hypothetical protein n=1 Tax=Duganella sp. SG902 TaxID=2587016 RepID=UPI00159EA7A8|nr:hypothetical protein [Duganella sp. SG902]NVM74785.1 hypothetical protein [Duganella sp. SG902]
MKSLTSFILIVSAVCTGQAAEAQTSGLIGRWEHRFPGDSEGDIIVLRLEHDVIKGDYMGLEREGEHGLYYSATEIKDLEAVNGEIRFIVPSRNFFVKRPKNPAQANAWAKNPSGGSNEKLEFQGHLVNGKLELACSSKFGGCPDTHMAFLRRAKPNSKFQRMPTGAAEQ